MVWVLIGACVVGYLVAWRLAFRVVREDIAPTSWANVVGIALWATLYALFVPLVLPVVLVTRAFKRVSDGRAWEPESAARRLGGESRAAKVKRRERERQAREAYIAQLERDLGIGD